jgi:hypothetical protein
MTSLKPTSPKPSPVELIAGARSRLALIAATRALIYGLAPALTAFAIAPALAPINDWAGLRFGYELAPAALIDLRIGLVAAGMIALALGAASAAIAWRRAHDYISAAERVDSIVNARQEILTLATLTDPSDSANSASSAVPSRANRPALFPILWQRACTYLANFSPARAFRFDLGRPLMRGSALSVAIVAMLAMAMMVLARPPSPEAAQAQRLREIARAIETTSPTESGRALAKALRDTATVLESHKLPPEQKLKLLAELTNNLQRIKPPNSPQIGNPHDKLAKGSSGGSGNSANGGEGAGSGQGKGSGGDKAEAKGSGTGKNNDQQMEALEKELSQAKERIENESAPGDKSMPKTEAGGSNGNAAAPGKNPNQPGAANRPDDSAQNQRPKPGENAPPSDKSGQGGEKTANDDKGSTKGDTRLGQFPAPVRYERFYKPGEHGPPIEIKDARYVVFRLPSGATPAGAGKAVLDTGRPEASTPYSNAPLTAERLEASPDERQLVPPRYRDLIQ